MYRIVITLLLNHVMITVLKLLENYSFTSFYIIYHTCLEVLGESHLNRGLLVKWGR